MTALLGFRDDTNAKTATDLCTIFLSFPISSFRVGTVDVFSVSSNRNTSNTSWNAYRPKLSIPATRDIAGTTTKAGLSISGFDEAKSTSSSTPSKLFPFSKTPKDQDLIRIIRNVMVVVRNI